jgi:hypothetical protein
MRTYVSPPDYAFQDRGLIFVITDPAYGVVWLSEHKPELGQQERLEYYHAAEDSNGDPAKHSTAKIVTLRGGTTGLLGEGDDGIGVLQWVDGGIEYFVLGPELSADEALRFAETV